MLSTWGPKDGLCQMVLSRTGFGFLGNILPSGLNAIVGRRRLVRGQQHQRRAGAARARSPACPSSSCLVIIVVLELGIAFFGHNLVHVFERFAFPVLTVIFVIAAIWVLTKAHPGAASAQARRSADLAAS